MNIGGYDKYVFNESKGNVILKEFLESNKMIKTHFTEGEKGINLDGNFELLKNDKTKKVPIGKFEVQIKTLDHNYINLNKYHNVSQYKYSCDTKIFNVVKEGITFNPCYLFLVDVRTSKIFAIYIDFEYVMKLNLTKEETKEIYFNDVDEIKDVDSFYNISFKILLNSKRAIKSFKENKFAIKGKLSFDETNILQNEFDYINNVFENELLYIKKQLFPNVWKFGIAYMKEKDSTGIGIYSIYRGNNGEFIRKLNSENFKFCSFITIKKDSNVRTHINAFIKSVLENCFKLKIIPLEYVGNEILFEICFSFLDKISGFYKEVENIQRPGYYFKDSVDVKMVKAYFTAMEIYSKNKVSNYFDSVVKNSQDALFLSDPFEDICYGRMMNENRKNLVKCFQKINKKERYIFDYNILLRGKYPYQLIKNAIIELERRNINEIKRIWLPKNWLDFELKINKGEHFKVENGYTIEDYYNNLIKLILILPDQYNYLFTNLLDNDLKIKEKYEYFFTKNDDFIIRYVKSFSDCFSTVINDNLSKLTDKEILSMFKEKKYKTLCSAFKANVFDEQFPLLNHINYIFIKKIGEKYNIDNLDLENRNLIM